MFANVAMILLARQHHVKTTAWIAMSIGGNAGMAGGMMLGGWLATQVEITSVREAAIVSFCGMTAGMVGGMLLGTCFVHNLLNSTARL
jgi:hypothetical protein